MQWVLEWKLPIYLYMNLYADTLRYVCIAAILNTLSYWLHLVTVRVVSL
jgi:hypothetical protein